jgi:hypothetical protein
MNIGKAGNRESEKAENEAGYPLRLVFRFSALPLFRLPAFPPSRFSQLLS